MAADPRIKKACIAMKIFGIPEAKVRPVLRQLRKTYANNWDFIEDENYKVLLDAILDEDMDQATEKKEKGKNVSNDVAMNRGKKKSPEKTQLVSKDEEDDIDEDEPLIKRFSRKRERGCDNNIRLSVGSSTSKKRNIEDCKQSQLGVKDKSDERERGCDNNRGVSLGCTSAKKLNEGDRKHTQLAVKDKEEDKRERGCDNNTGLTLGSTTSKKKNEEDRKPEEEGEDDEMTELPPLKRYLRRTGEKVSARTVNDNTSPRVTSSMSMEPEELAPVMLLPADPVVTEKEPVSCALIIVNTDPLTDHESMIPDAENCSAPVLEMVKSNMSVEEDDGETNTTLNDTTAVDIPPSEKVCEMIKAGEESSTDDITMGLVVVPECEISADGWRAFSNKRDIALGKEHIEIPWVNEINDQVPTRFHYIPQSYVFQEAAVKFSVSSISHDQCCFPCIGDCLGSSSMPCNCIIAYTEDGVLKEDFLEARISEARDQRKQVLQFCQECPLEKAKKEEILEPCKGHIKRKAIKECWIKCGCSKRCGNRLVQRGIHNKLEVFFTSDGKGWGLRTLERLPQGSFVCEYIGEILTISELYQRALSSPVILDAHWGCSEETSDDRKSLCLDGSLYGNVSRFINHRCLDANLIEIPVHVETPDQHYYHLAFFTTREIEAMEELTWDYGVDFNDEDCRMKLFDCVCGSRFCRNPKRSKKAKKVMNGA